MENFLNVKQYWKNLETYRLQTNYRSKSHIVQAGHHLIKKNKKQYDKEAFAHRNETDHIVVIGSENEIEEAKNVIQLIKESVKNSKLTYNDIAILYRKNKLS
jgi:DNA helicase-2/ATP-dependent DNA helicase PcrA